MHAMRVSVFVCVKVEKSSNAGGNYEPRMCSTHAGPFTNANSNNLVRHTHSNCFFFR